MRYDYYNVLITISNYSMKIVEDGYHSVLVLQTFKNEFNICHYVTRIGKLCIEDQCVVN